MNSNSNNKDFTQYSIKCSNYLASIFETLNKFKDCQSEQDKNKISEELSDNITDFELNLDNCTVGINESISKIINDRNESKSNNNNNMAIETNNQGNRRTHQIEQISDENIINQVVKRISMIKLDA